MSRKRKIIFSAMFIIAAIAYVIYWAFFDIQRIKGHEILQEIPSADGTYTVTIYLNNGGATTSYAILGTVKNNESGKKRNIYWVYPCEGALARWKDDTTVIINGVELDVRKDSYDYRIDRKPDIDEDIALQVYKHQVKNYVDKQGYSNETKDILYVAIDSIRYPDDIGDYKIIYVDRAGLSGECSLIGADGTVYEVDVDEDDWYVVIGDTTLHRYYNAIIDRETLEYLGTVPIA